MVEQTLTAIRQLQAWDVPTSLRNLARLLNLSSRNSVKLRLEKLERDGYIEVKRMRGYPNKITIL